MHDRVLTRNQTRRVDQFAIERYGMSGLVLMENAGRSATDIIRREFPVAHRAMIVCGSGNNGGDGCVIARHLSNAGWDIRVLIAAKQERMPHDASANYAIVQSMALSHLITTDTSHQVDYIQKSIDDQTIIIDALLGTGFSGDVRPGMSDLIDAINGMKGQSRAIVAIDVPSGLDCQTGTPSNATIRAGITITFVANKTGFTLSTATPYVGRVCVADIGVPTVLLDQISEMPDC